MDDPKFSIKQEAVLDLLRTGLSANKSCKGANISTSSLYNWKRGNPEFLKAFDAAVRQGKIVEKELKLQGTPIGLVSDPSKAAFLKSYRECGDRRHAATKAGLSYESVILSLEPEHPEYDEAFASEYNRAEIVVKHMLLDKFIGVAMGGQGSEVQASLKWALERLFPEKFGNKKKLEVEHTSTVQLDDQQAAFLLEKFWKDGAIEVDGYNVKSAGGSSTAPGRLQGASEDAGGATPRALEASVEDPRPNGPLLHVDSDPILEGSSIP